MSTFYVAISGRPFKVINVESGLLAVACHTRQEAQQRADELHRINRDHYVVYRVEMCGGSKRLSDIA